MCECPVKGHRGRIYVLGVWFVWWLTSTPHVTITSHLPTQLQQMCVSRTLSCVRLCVTLWTVAHQAPLSMEFSRLEYWNRLPFPPAGDLPNPGIEPASLMSPALAGRFFTTSATWEAMYIYILLQNLLHRKQHDSHQFTCGMVTKEWDGNKVTQNKRHLA